jgi:hypothetical protein
MKTFQPLIAVVRKYSLATGCLVALIAIAVAFVWRLDLLDQARERLDGRKAEGRNIDKNLQNAATLESHFAALREGRVKLEAKLIHAEDLATNQEYFFKLENSTGLKLSQLRQITTAPAKGRKAAANAPLYQPVAFSLSLEGTFARVLAFLNALENGPHVCRLTSISVQRSGSSGAGDIRGTDVAVNLNLELLGPS